MEGEKNISYHDATILDMYRSENDLMIILDDVHIGNSTSPVFLTCQRVKKIIVENNEHESKLVYATEGDVWSLDISETYLDLIVDWHDFVNKKIVVKCYHVEYENIDIKIK